MFFCCCRKMDRTWQLSPTVIRKAVELRQPSRRLRRQQTIRPVTTPYPLLVKGSTARHTDPPLSTRKEGKEPDPRVQPVGTRPASSRQEQVDGGNLVSASPVGTSTPLGTPPTPTSDWNDWDWLDVPASPIPSPPQSSQEDKSSSQTAKNSGRFDCVNSTKGVVSPQGHCIRPKTPVSDCDDWDFLDINTSPISSPPQFPPEEGTATQTMTISRCSSYTSQEKDRVSPHKQRDRPPTPGARMNWEKISRKVAEARAKSKEVARKTSGTKIPPKETIAVTPSTTPSKKPVPDLDDPAAIQALRPPGVSTHRRYRLQYWDSNGTRRWLTIPAVRTVK